MESEGEVLQKYEVQHWLEDAHDVLEMSRHHILLHCTQWALVHLNLDLM